MKPKITLKEIAELAGVHRSTVDKVVHNRVGVSDSVRADVQKLLDEYGYVPNQLGQALQKQNDTFYIDAILLNVNALQYITDGIKTGIDENDVFNIKMSVNISDFLDIKTQEKLILNSIKQKVNGIILHPINSPEIVRAVNKAAEAGIDVVTCNFDLENSKRMCFIGQDERKAALVSGRLMGEFLSGKGKVGIIASRPESETPFFEDSRVSGFVDLIEKEYTDIEILDSVIGYDNPKVIRENTRKLLKKYPDISGLYVTGGGVDAIGEELKKHEYEHAIKVITYEAYSYIIDLLNEGVVTCTISSDLQEQGRLSVDTLVKHFIYNKTPETERFFVASEILVKESFN